MEIMHRGVERELQRSSKTRDRASIEEVHQAVGVFLLVRKHRVKTWYEANNRSTTLKRHKFNKIRGKFGKFSFETLERMETSLCQASRPW